MLSELMTGDYTRTPCEFFQDHSILINHDRGVYALVDDRLDEIVGEPIPLDS